MSENDKIQTTMYTDTKPHLFSFPPTDFPTGRSFCPSSASCSRRIIRKYCCRSRSSSSCCGCLRPAEAGGGGVPNPPVKMKKATMTTRKRRAPTCFGRRLAMSVSELLLLWRSIHRSGARRRRYIHICCMWMGGKSMQRLTPRNRSESPWLPSACAWRNSSLQSVQSVVLVLV